MESEAKSVEGGCFCGAVRFRVALPVSYCVHCHCSMCRRNHGAGYVTWVAVPKERFEVTAGQAALRDFRSSDTGKRSFCGTCGSSLFCELTQHPGEIDVVRANFDGPIGIEPQAHIFFGDHVDWVAVDEKLPRIGGPGGE
jgi:hypothetical protein